MVDKKVYEEDWDDVEEEIKKASTSGGNFVDLKNDGDEIFVAFIQKAQTRKVESKKWGIKSKSRANVAVFDGGTQFVGIEILSLAPTHWGGFAETRREYGGDKVFKIRRKGVEGDTNTIYLCFLHRDMTDDDQAVIDKFPLHDLWPDAVDDLTIALTTDPPPPTASKEFNERVGAEMKRLEWEPQGVKVAMRTYFNGSPATGAEMSHEQREVFITALQGMAPGDAPASIGYQETGEPLDLDGDVDFF